MNDILIETCNYICKNKGLSRNKYIKEMSKRSIWKGVNVENQIDYMVQLGILNEVTKYSNLYKNEYVILEVDIRGFMCLYNNSYKNEFVIYVLEYIQNHSKKSNNTFKNIFSEITSANEGCNNYLNSFLKLKNYGVLRLKTEYFNNYKYYGLRIDFHQLKSFVSNVKDDIIL